MAEHRAYQSLSKTESSVQQEEEQNPAKLDLADLRTALENTRIDCARMSGKLLEAETEMFAVTRQWQNAEAEAVRLGERQAHERRQHESTIGQLDALLDEALRHMSIRPDPRANGDILAKAGLLNDKLAGRREERADTNHRGEDPRSQQSGQGSNGDSRDQNRLDERFREIAVLTRLLKQNQHEANREREQRQWLGAIMAVLLKQPWWWALLPKAWHNRRIHERLRERGIFDAQAYLAAQPDVAASGIDPLQHYVVHGMNEGRALR